MSVPGTIYGVVLNDLAERDALAGDFGEKPYAAPPRAPVVYIKPRSSVSQGVVRIGAGQEVRVAATIGLLFSRDASMVSEADALGHVGAACLALDVSYPQANYYRPAIAQLAVDRFLPLGAFGAPELPSRLVARISGAGAHEWSLDRLVRSPAKLVADLSQFMTLRAGDLLLVGLPGDAPLVGAGSRLTVAGGSLPPLEATIEADARGEAA